MEMTVCEQLMRVIDLIVRQSISDDDILGVSLSPLMEKTAKLQVTKPVFASIFKGEEVNVKDYATSRHYASEMDGVMVTCCETIQVPSQYKTTI
jgi:hypothetical protein